MSGAAVRQASVAGLLGVGIDDQLDPRADLWGFGGMHGGLTLALLAEQMQGVAPGTRLRSVTAQYHRALRQRFRMDAQVVRAGRTLAATAGQASVDGRPAVTATGIFTTGTGDRVAVPGSTAPEAPPPSECPVYTIPAEFVPFARHTEIRPVGPNRPFEGGREPELAAWIRLLADDEPPDAFRLVVLMDSLAPSYAAVLDAPVAIPTIEFTVRPTRATGETSPWILLHTRTLDADGVWVDEQINAWSPDGVLLATATQLRRVTA